MKHTYRIIGAAFVLASPFRSGDTFAQADSFQVTIDPVAHGAIALEPPLPEGGKVKEGTVVTVRAKADPGYALDSIYYSVPGRWGAMYHESLTPKFRITIDQDKHIGASFISPKKLPTSM